MKHSLAKITACVTLCVHAHDGSHNPLGIKEIELNNPLFSRVISAGYADTFGTEAYPRTGDPYPRTVNGRFCVTASHLLFDVSDRQHYDLNGPSTITFEFFAPRAMRVQFGYDASARAEQLRWIELKADSNIQRISMTLPDARLVNRGLSHTDFALIAEGAVSETQRPDHRHEFTLCDLQFSAAQRRETAASIEARFTFTADGEPTPVRLGLYDVRSGEISLPSDHALSIYHYDGYKQQHFNRSIWDSNDPWPHSNRYFIYAPSDYQVTLEPGDYWLVASRGPEYGIEKRRITVSPLNTHVNVNLERRVEMPGWYAGDGHVHMLRDSPEMNSYIAQIAAAEGLTVLNLLQMGNLKREYFQQYAFGKAGRYAELDAHLIPGVENPRSAVLGHTISQNIQQSLYNRNHYFDHHRQFSGYREQGAVTGYAHVDQGWYNEQRGLALDVPLGAVDFVEVMQNGQIKTDLWYSFLNLGFKLAPMAGSDYPYLDSPGSVRLYAKVEGEFSTHKWFASAKLGKSFVTNGPLIDFKVDNHQAGDEIILSQPTKLAVRATVSIATSLDELRDAALIVNGRIAESFKAADNGKISVSTRLAVDRGAWIALAVRGKQYALAHTGAVYVNFTHEGHGITDKSGIAKTMIGYLEQLNAEARASAELEYHDVGQIVGDAWRQQRPLLTKQIDSAIAIYRGMIRE